MERIRSARDAPFGPFSATAQRVERTNGASIIDNYASAGERRRLYTCVERRTGAHASADRYLGFFSSFHGSGGDCAVARRTSMHADESVGGYGGRTRSRRRRRTRRMPRGLFADDPWPRLSVARARQFHSIAPRFLRSRADYCPPNDLSIARRELTGYCRRVKRAKNW